MGFELTESACIYFCSFSPNHVVIVGKMIDTVRQLALCFSKDSLPDCLSVDLNKLGSEDKLAE